MKIKSKSLKLFFLSLFLCIACFGQQLDFQTIQSLFTLDSGQFQIKCTEKGFILDSIKNEKFNTEYFFTYKNDNKIKTSMRYSSNDNPNSNLFQYIFQSKIEYEDFIKQMTDKGFEDSDPIKQNKFGGQFVQRLYTKGNITVSLGTFKERREFKCYVLTYFQKQKK